MRTTIFTLLLVGMALAASPAADDATTSMRPDVVSSTDAVTIPRLLSYQGKLTDNAGNPVIDTTYSVLFGLYTAPSGGSAFWSETQTVRTSGGLFSVLLGSVTPIGTLPDAGAVYLGTKVAADPEMTPRLRIVSSAYAYLTERAANADLLQGKDTSALDGRYVNEGQAAGGSLTGTYPDPVLAPQGAGVGQVLKWTGSAWRPGNDSVGPGGGSSDNAWVRGTPDSVLFTVRRLGIARGGSENMLHGGYRQTHVNLGVACTTGESGQNRFYSTVGGGQRNTAGGNHATVAGGKDCRAGSAYSGVLSGVSNQAGTAFVESAATVCGGKENIAGALCATIGGGAQNRANVPHSAISGGLENTIDGEGGAIGGGYHNYVYGEYGTIGGGYRNEANNDRATVGGGTNNAAAGNYSMVGGGNGNVANGSHSAIGGGWGNVASGSYSAVGGGYANATYGQYATIGGGYSDTLWSRFGGVLSGAYNNIGTALYPDTGSVICGGYGNVAGGKYCTVAGGYSNCAATMVATVGGGRNNSSGPYCTVAGGDSNRTGGWYSTVGGGQHNYASGDHSTIGGGEGNRAGPWAVVAGGRSNEASGLYSVATGGHYNRAEGWYSAIGAGKENYTTAFYSMIGAGVQNAARDSMSFIGGGSLNCANGPFSIIGGGLADTTKGYCSGVLSGKGNLAGDAMRDSGAVVAGGHRNRAIALFSNVNGGLENTASNECAAVGGGYDNVASDTCATVAGGYDGLADGFCATIGGGRINTASGEYATIPGGTSNRAKGACSFAAGRYACANHGGSFVWGDSSQTADSVYTTGSNQFRVRARGGTWFFSNQAMSTGAYLAANSNSWASACDSTTKEDFREVDRAALLDEVAGLRIRNYKMKDQDDGTRHIGPVAQDFHRAFGCGETNTGINMADMDGVTLAAIQALYEQNRLQQAEIEQLKAELRARR